MTVLPPRSQPVLLAALVAVLALAGCGSSKPGYCADRSKLEDSITSLASAPLSGGVSGLQTQIKTVQSNANQLVASAKSDFPSQTSAISSSVNALKSSVDALPSSPSATQLTTVATDAANVASAVKGFADASSSKCS